MIAEGVATAILRKGGDYLLMKRADDRKAYPGFWAGVGGRIENGEMQTPEAACLREIREETGITPERVLNLTLRYVCVASKAEYIIIHYIYFGETDAAELTESDEGTLHWIPSEMVMKQGFSRDMGFIMNHYFTTAINDSNIYLYNETTMSMEILR